MKELSIFILAGLFLFSCNSSEKANEKSDNSDSTDTTHVSEDSIVVDTVSAFIPELSEDLKQLLARSTSNLELPLDLDSAKLSSVLKMCEEALSVDEVKILSSNIISHSYSANSKYWIEKFYEIEGLKAKGKYEDYVDGLDIGMLRDIDASIGPIIVVDSSKKIMLWKVSYGSFEACPYFSGEVLMATIMVNNEIINCALVGEFSGGGDAPYWSDTFISSLIENDGFRSIQINSSGGDEDEEGNEIIETKKTDIYINITSEGFVEEK